MISVFHWQTTHIVPILPIQLERLVEANVGIDDDFGEEAAVLAGSMGQEVVCDDHIPSFHLHELWRGVLEASKGGQGHVGVGRV